MKKKISIKDLARLTGTSVTTVSFVMNGKADEMRISKPVAEKILEASREMGYYPNQLAVSLRTGHTNIIVLIVESVSGNFFATLARVVEEEAALYGYKVMYCSTQNDLERASGMMRMLQQMQMEGYIITPMQGMQDDIQTLLSRGKSVVMVDSYLPEVEAPYVLVDNYNGVTEGVAHLAQSGYLNIGFITVDLPLVQICERTRAYCEGIQRHQLTMGENQVLKLPFEVLAEEAIQRIMTFIQEQPQLDALFFAANYIGVWGLEAITRLSLRIPADIGVLSFDDHDVFRVYPPGITVVEQPIEDIARASIQLLMQQLGKDTCSPALQHRVQIPSRLVVRGSTAGKRPGV